MGRNVRARGESLRRGRRRGDLRLRAHSPKRPVNSTLSRNREVLPEEPDPPTLGSPKLPPCVGWQTGSVLRRSCESRRCAILASGHLDDVTDVVPESCCFAVASSQEFRKLADGKCGWPPRVDESHRLTSDGGVTSLIAHRAEPVVGDGGVAEFLRFFAVLAGRSLNVEATRNTMFFGFRDSC